MIQWNKAFIVAYFTFKEILKSKILLNVFLLGLGLILSIYVATEFTYGVPQKIALDFGLGTLSLSAIGISLFLGASLVSKEIDSRTVYMVISRPVRRASFILGKVMGLMGIQVLNMLILSGMTIGAVLALGGKLEPLIFWSLLFTLLESILLLLVVIFFSLFTNTIITVLMSFVILIAGYGIQSVMDSVFVKSRVGLESLLKLTHFIFPAFYKFNLKDFILYESNLAFSYLGSHFLYGISYCIFLLVLIMFIFEKKNID